MLNGAGLRPFNLLYRNLTHPDGLGWDDGAPLALFGNA